ncbi:MAG: VOC family protein [Candidatus Daviesbacteria bacterium]|nr:VOC family protein [Candidatus Daviesbacteria bacterium]
MKSNSLLPELYVTDFKKSLHFYTEILNFTIEYRRDSPSFASLSYQGNQIMIQEIDPNEDKAFITGDFEYPFGRGINFQINTDNVQELSNSLKDHNYPLRREAKDSWYKVDSILSGCRQILVQDPDGYLLRFSQDIGEKDIT